MLSYREILADLIAIDTNSTRDTLKCVDYVKHYLARHNVNSKIIYNAAKTRGSIFATIGNPENALVLNGHLDTVPVMADAWQTDPFVLTEQGDKFFGCGVCDMKGAIAVALSMVPYFIKNKQNVGLLFTHDEETADNGIVEALADHDVMNYLHKASGVVVMEPSKRHLIMEHKNSADVMLCVSGMAAHSSDPALGVDAIRHLNDAMNLFYSMLDEHREENESFDVPYSTGVITQISGGTAVNIVPDRATMTMSVRFMTDAAMDAFIHAYSARLMEIQDKNPQVRFEFGITSSMPALNKITGAYFDRLPFARAGNVSYCTDAGQFYKHNIPAIIYGPGDIAQAHTNNEFITVAELDGFANDLMIVGNLFGDSNRA